MTLDGFLNVVIPAGIFIAILVFIYSKGKEHIDKFFEMIKDWFQNMGNKDEGEVEESTHNYGIEYRQAGY